MVTKEIGMLNIPKWVSIISLVLSAACWGLATVMSKGILVYIPPITLLVTQLCASVIFLWTIVGVKKLPIPHSTEAIKLGLTGLLEPGLAYTFGLLGLAFTSASMASLIVGVEPIIITCLAWLFMRERPSRRTIIFTIIAVLGMILVVGVDAENGDFHSIIGNLLTAIGVFCGATYVILSRRIVTKLDPVLLVALQQTVGFIWAIFIWLISFFLINGENDEITFAPHIWLWAIASGIIYYALAFWFYIAGLKRTSAGVAGLFLNLIPVFGVVGSYMFLGEQLTSLQWIGAVLILVAVISVSRLESPTTSSTL